MAALLGTFFFKSRMNELSSQLETYASNEYSLIYVLNYATANENEFVFPDTDIQLFLDVNGAERLTVSCLMLEQNVNYSLGEFREVKKINSGEVILSRNVAERYNLKIGDTVFAQYPYSASFFALRISGIGKTEYDHTSPVIANQIGIAYVGYDEEYINSTKYKCALFASESKSIVLAEYPQVISTIINKSDNYDSVFGQGVFILLFDILFVISILVICEYFFFSNSFRSLKRLYLKGYSKKNLVRVPLMERVVFLILPAAIGASISMYIMPCNSKLTICYYSISAVLCLFYVVVCCVRDLFRSL